MIKIKRDTTLNKYNQDNFYMQLALNAAWEYQGLTYPNPAVGATVVMDGKILSVCAHKKAGTAHAEVLALLEAYENISKTTVDFDASNAKEGHAFLLSLPKDYFAKCSIYVTLEPCSHEGKTPSCASLLQKLNLAHVAIGTKDSIVGHDGGLDKLSNASIGVLEKECKDLIEPFLIWQKRAFVLFKIAQTSNGRVGGGYLSCKDSLTHVHKLRDACTCMLVGGNTVRTDRPKLDCRFIEAQAPDIKIYSKQKDFDRDIELFNISNREVAITDNLDFLEQPSFILVEGAQGMLNALKDKIDMMLIYQTPKLSTNSLTYNTAMNLEFLHTQKMSVDMMIWSRNLGH
jgi:diaminohydroxyphosphoribosylaminopyrimidine deaminase/5-amino-6-(5-phosphoribosylamino)uracil reductase